MKHFSQFEWPVSAGGYRWEDEPPVQPFPDVDVGDPLLVSTVGADREPLWYSPLDDALLHRRFAKIRLTQSAIVKFANKHGLLTEGQFVWWSDPVERPMCRGEALGLWAREIVALRNLVQIRDLAQAKNIGALRHFVVWRDGPQRVMWLSGEPSSADDWSWSGFTPREIAAALESDLERAPGAVIARSGDRETAALLERWRPGDVLEPARYYLFREVNRRLDGHTSPVVDPFTKGRIFLRPDSLLTALYVQFAIELAEWNRTPIVCRGCGSFFSPTHARQEFCVETCRKRHWYLTRRGGSDGGQTGER